MRFQKTTLICLLLALLIVWSGCASVPGSVPSSNTTTSPVTEPFEPESSRTEPQSTEEPPVPPEESFRLSFCRPREENGHYLYNPFLLSEECLEIYGEEFAEFYYRFLKAYLEHETVCACPSEDAAMSIDMVLLYECPFYAQNDLEISWTDYDYETHTISWSYREDAAVISERAERVADVIQSYLNLISTEDRDAIKMQTLYHAFCPQLTYDYDMMASRDHVEASYVLLNHRGICVNFSYALAMIANQAGLFATTASGSTRSGEAHAWNYIRIQGEFFFFDPTFELSFKSGTCYVYYGMTDEERERDVSLASAFIGHYGKDFPSTPDIHLNVY